MIMPRSLHRLSRTQDFSKVYLRGLSKKGTYGKLVLYRRNDGNPWRLGISVSAKVGGAVERNKVKRQIREIFRKNFTQIQESLDIVYVVWNIGATFRQREQEILRLLSMFGKFS